jgi:hypothetical protein
MHCDPSRKRHAFATGSRLLATVSLLATAISHAQAVIVEHSPSTTGRYQEGVAYSQRHLTPDAQAVVGRIKAGDWSGLTVHSRISEALGTKPGTMTELIDPDLILDLAKPLRNSQGFTIYPPDDFDVIRYPKGTVEYRRACQS